MKKTIILALALALVGGAAYANFCARDVVPSATLLVPYIVVDADSAGNPNPNGYTTLTVVTNVSSAAQIIHVVVYNAASAGVVDFDEVLSGYDVWSINWRDVVTGDFENFDTGSPSTGFWNGTTGTIGSPYGPTTNVTGMPPVGLDSPQDIDSLTTTTCGFPWGYQGAYKSIIIGGLQAPLKVWGTQDTDCNTATTSDQIPSPGWLQGVTTQPLFFYATIDVVKACSGLFPSQDTTYWTNSVLDQQTDLTGPGYNSSHNVLTAYDIYLNPTQNYSESYPAVHIEAYNSWATAGNTGFYTRYQPSGSYDNREPLGNAFSFNYFNSGGVTTKVAVWKNESDINATAKLILACHPYIYYAFDENEVSNSRTQTTCPSGLCFGNPEPNVFPFETQMVPVTQANFNGLMPANGWMMLIFDPAIPFTGTNSKNIQAYVFAKYNYGTYSTGVEAATLANVYCYAGQTLPYLNSNLGNGINNFGILYQ
jgi:hypothetical protein